MMSGKKKLIDQDLVKVFDSTKDRKLLTMLAWGDQVELLGKSGKEFYEIKTTYYKDLPDGGFEKIVGKGLLKKNTKLHDPEDMKILKVSFVDVQQGDGIVIESPDGHLILVDGGDNALFARYLAQRFIGTSTKEPLEVDAIVVTHGDADHFVGLTEIHRSENHRTKRKQLFIHPHRIFHNGIVKGPSTLSVTEILGNTQVFNNRLYITELHDNLLEVDRTKLNKPFGQWIAAIRAWEKHSEHQNHIVIKRLQYGDDKSFSFLNNENIEVRVLGPFVEDIDGKPALPFLFEPPKTPPVELKEQDASTKTNSAKNSKKKNYSASHTINGHSVVLQLRYGKINFLFAGDLNQESEIMLQKLVNDNKIDIRSEVFKVPHHGSADFEPSFLDLISPAISIISSGDESARKEFIHPRATLVGSVGRHSRLRNPLVFVTEMVAFFELVGNAIPVTRNKISKKAKEFFAFKRAQFGIVHVRTDGNRVLVFTHSGRTNMKEAYALVVKENNEVIFDKVKM
jgi:beta-lactamase superfamily II metal-dependent hydrolase